MRYAFVPFAFGLGANALVARASTQCFKLQASGGASGVLGQLDDGQNRVGGGHPTGCYCLDGNGGFTDSNGRGCILTPPTTQFQCDVGATPTNGFAVSSSGSVTYNGSGKFYACPVNDNGEYNVYTVPAPGQTKCVEISLGSAGSCGAGASQPAGSQPAGTPPAATTVVTQTKPAASQPPYPTSPPATGPSKPSNTGYPGKPEHSGKPEGKPSQPAHSQPAHSQPAHSQPAPSVPVAPKPSQPAVQSPKPTPEAPKPSQPAVQPPKPSPSMPGVPQESVCVPNVVTVTVTGPVAPPAPSMPAASMPAPSMPAPSKPAPSMPAPSMPAPSMPAPSKPAPSMPAPSMPADHGNSSCPEDLNGNYEYPHLIVPVDSEHPDKAYGTSYNGKISGHVCTIFNFDIPASYAGKTCSTMFMLPKKADLETSDYTMSGHAMCTVSKLKGNANAQTTYSNKPAKVGDVASMELTPGNTYPVESGACEAGQTVSYEICGSGDFSIDYFQDYNPSPIGMYIRQC